MFESRTLEMNLKNVINKAFLCICSIKMQREVEFEKNYKVIYNNVFYIMGEWVFKYKKGTY